MDWIGVGLSVDVPAKTVFPARIDGAELAVWCSASGVYHAWKDRCPHRGMRLSHGFVRGESLSCIYHGWQYESGGRCGHIPAHPALKPPKTICATAFDCTEQGGVIWVALNGAKDDPPDMGARQSIRSMAIERSADDVAKHLGHEVSAVIVAGGQLDLALALQPIGSQSCIVHALARPDCDRKLASRKVEQLRTRLEA